jgi:hypothetical protein
MSTQITFPKPFQWFIKIGISIAGIVGLINVEIASHKSGCEFFIMVGIELVTLCYGLWLTRFIDE